MEGRVDLRTLIQEAHKEKSTLIAEIEDWSSFKAEVFDGPLPEEWLPLEGLTLAGEEESPRFVVCIRNDGYPASLEKRKIYRALQEWKSKANDTIRVIDESGEDYLYPASFFVSIDNPEAVKRSLLHSGV